ncbi:hypothetical protein HYFRA_00003145 [Hymenoscyphus fraxineus]|uniref:DNA (cytosine-5-)-methyltransferase n=1 Tax=Hymenoscyphus fraxineus TaxID=746836 RepID=A0A9N9KPX3_9HELO|nr:hypothetical protein HYFRA_00003145 [Hymenoscyphus fraxineus]
MPRIIKDENEATKPNSNSHFFSPDPSPHQFFDAVSNTSSLKKALDLEKSMEGWMANRINNSNNTIFDETQSSTSTSSLSSLSSTSSLADVLPTIETGNTSIEPETRPSSTNSGGKNILLEERIANNLTSDEDEDSTASWQLPNLKSRLKFKSEMADFIYPKSCYAGYKPPLPIIQERFAVENLIREIRRIKAESPSDRSEESNEFFEIELSDFSVYSPDKKTHGLKLNGLQHLHTRKGNPVFLFDGILSVGDMRHYVEGIPFQEVPVGNYGKDLHTVGGEIWIRSNLNQKYEIYYRLKNPSKEYKRFHTGFLWLVDLAKHFVDFCHFCGPGLVTLLRFREEFSRWIWDQHENSEEFHAWWHEYNLHDFAQVIAVYAEFLYKECCGLDESNEVDELRLQPIWDEVLPENLKAVPKQRLEKTNTIVTPYVFELFNHLKFGSYLESVDITGISKKRHTSQVADLNLTEGAQRKKSNVANTKNLRPVRVGDVVSIKKDGPNSVWKDEGSRHRAAEECWYAYVVAVHEDEEGLPEFDVIWLYHPSETACAKMKYPWSREYFMSNHCTCEGDDRIQPEDVIGIKPVLWHSGPPNDGNSDKIFIRQTFLDQERFVTLKESHKTCTHHRNNTSDTDDVCEEYPVGQTVYSPPVSQKKNELEVYEVAEYVDGGKRVMLRRFIRRQEFDGTGKPNELVYSEKLESHLISKISGRCLVRFYTQDDVAQGNIPVPYNRDGNGNAFYVATRLVESDGEKRLIPIHDNLPRSVIQGFDPSVGLSRPVLRGMDLYCGGGNFGRGLEEGGAVRNEWAVDYDDTAIHTYRANLKDPDKVKLFHGSVDDLLYQAMKGNPRSNPLIPVPGEVDFISAGSPCQGFSLMNSLRDNKKGLKNQSLIASVAAFVDVYRPKYGILENVVNMAQKGLGRDEDILSQLVCAIVGMGYQVDIQLLDAWSYGSPQGRSRIFVTFTAPGLEPLRHPHHSHSHPQWKKSLGLGKLANGEAFGHRQDMPTPFSYISIGKATEHLPLIGDAQTNQCTPYPYHVLALGIPASLKYQIDCIPTHPRGMNFAKTWAQGKGVMSKEDRTLFPSSVTSKGRYRESVMDNSRAWGRVIPTRLTSTIMVRLHATDSRMGSVLHWDEPRYMSVAEAQIAQGFLNGEVMIGRSHDWFRILGNSVCRNVSLALGLSLRDAWLGSEDVLPSTIANSVPARVTPSWRLTDGFFPSDSTDELMREDSPLLATPAPALRKETRIVPAKRKAILPPAKEKDHKMPRIGSASIGAAVRDALNSNEMQAQLARAQESCLAATRTNSQYQPYHDGLRTFSPSSFASPEHHKRFQARNIVTPSTGRTKLPSSISASHPALPSSSLSTPRSSSSSFQRPRPKSPRPHVSKKYKTTVEVLVEVIDLISDDEDPDESEKEVLAGTSGAGNARIGSVPSASYRGNGPLGGFPGTGVEKYRPVDNSIFGAYGSTRGAAARAVVLGKRKA